MHKMTSTLRLLPLRTALVGRTVRTRFASALTESIDGFGSGHRSSALPAFNAVVGRAVSHHCPNDNGLLPSKSCAV